MEVSAWARGTGSALGKEPTLWRSFAKALPVAALVVASIAAPVAARVIDGTSGPDVLVGTAIHGRGGADRIFGTGGPDTIHGGRDMKRDRLYGGSGNDRIHAYTGDRVYAGSGNDVIWIRGGVGMAMTRVDCGSGRDHVYGVGGTRQGWLHSIAKDCERID